eukprot:4080296-Amphidinium_carterae.4
MFRNPPGQSMCRSDLCGTMPGRLPRDIPPLPHPRRRLVCEKEVRLPPIWALIMNEGTRTNNVLRLDVTV